MAGKKRWTVMALALAAAVVLAAGCGTGTGEESASTAGDLAAERTSSDEESIGEPLQFETVTLDNEPVTQDIFSDYDITVVHVWGTYCGPCIAEMGEYAKMYRMLPDNVNLVGVICDVYEDSDDYSDDARGILSDAGAEFLNLRSNDEIDGITGELQFVPSSFFVDSEGRIIGEMMDGVNFDQTKKRLAGYIKN